MSTVAAPFKPYAILANCSLLAGLFMVLQASLTGAALLLPVRILTLADYLLAAGLIPHLSAYMAQIACHCCKISIKPLS